MELLREREKREKGRGEWRQKRQINKIGCKEWWVCCGPARGGDERTDLS